MKKLPYRTASGELDWDRRPLAVAAVTVGYRGQVVDLPMEERKRIARKLLRLYREADKEPPESLLKFLGQDENSVIHAKDYSSVRILAVNEDENNTIKSVRCVLHNAGETANGFYYDKNLLAESYTKWNGVECYNGHSFDHKIDDFIGVIKDVDYNAETGEILGTLYLSSMYSWLLEVAEIKKLANKSLALSSVIDVEAEYDFNNNRYVVRKINGVDSVDVVTAGATNARFLEINSKRNTGEELPEVEEPMNETTETRETHEVRDENVARVESNLLDANAIARVTNQNTMLMLFNNYNFNSFVKKQVEKYVSEASNVIPYSALEEYANALNKEFMEQVEGYVKNYNYAGYARVESEPVDKMRVALEGFFEDKDLKDEKGEIVPRYRSFRRFYEDLTGDVNVTGRFSDLNNKRLFAAFCGKDVNSITTDDFAIMLSNYLNRRLVSEYNFQNLSLGSWRRFADVVPVRDFRPQYRVRFGGYGDLPIVAQGANYNNITEVTDEQATYTVQKRGGTEDLTLEAIANDDVGYIRRIPIRLARAAARTLHKFVYNELVFNNPTVYDGATLFATNRNVSGVTVSNRGTKPTGGAYSITHIRDARVAMQKFPELNSAERIGIVPRFLIVPPDLEDLFMGMLSAERYPRLSGAANTENFPPNDQNWARNWRLEVLVNIFAPATDAIVLVADPADVPTIEIGFFGSEEPEIIVQDRPDVGSMFAADKITYKIRHIYGGAVIDFRGFYGYI